MQAHLSLGRRSHRCRGFTLIELLTALAILAVMAGLTWLGIDSMVRSRTMAQAHQDELAVLNVGLQQWVHDLNAMVETPPLSILVWDGRVLRLVRRSASDTANATDGLQIAAWTRGMREVNGKAQWQWLRWSSPPATSVVELRALYEQAGVWGQNPSPEQRGAETQIVPLEGWQLYFYRGGAWTNPLSQDVPLDQNQAISYSTESTGGASVDGIRLVLTLPAGHPMGGTITRDWMRPTLSGGNS